MRKLSILAVLVALMSCSGVTKTRDNQAMAESKGEVVVLNKADFIAKVFDYEKSQDWSYAGKKPCIIDFYADWCGPCKKVSPILKDLAGTYKDKLIVYKINVDEEEELAAAFGIQSIPSLLFIPVEGEPQMSVGALGRDELVERIDNFLLNRN